MRILQRAFLGCLALSILSTYALAQQLVLKEGVEVQLRFAESISSRNVVTEDPVNLVLNEDLKVGEVVVARTGARALGIITNAKRAGLMGKGGDLNMRLDYVRVGDVKVKLRGTRSREGESTQGTAIALTVLLGPVGIFKHGKEIEIKEGTTMKAFVADDVTVAAAKN